MNNQLWLTQRALNKGQQMSLLSVLVVHFSQSSAIEEEIATLRDLVGKVVKKALQKVSLLFWAQWNASWFPYLRNDMKRKQKFT
jgi:hypothetical protein